MPTCLSSILPRLKMMQPRANDMGIMNMGKTYSTAILQHATHSHCVAYTMRLDQNTAGLWKLTHAYMMQVYSCTSITCQKCASSGIPHHTWHVCPGACSCCHGNSPSPAHELAPALCQVGIDKEVRPRPVIALRSATKGYVGCASQTLAQSGAALHLLYNCLPETCRARPYRLHYCHTSAL